MREDAGIDAASESHQNRGAIGRPPGIVKAPGNGFVLVGQIHSAGAVEIDRIDVRVGQKDEAGTVGRPVGVARKKLIIDHEADVGAVGVHHVDVAPAVTVGIESDHRSVG
jgi:hypothetical protein